MDIADWLLYASEEISRILHYQYTEKRDSEVKVEVEAWCKRGIIAVDKDPRNRKVRARRLFFNKIKDIGDVKRADTAKLSQILGNNVALSVKKQVGQEIKEVPKGKRKGQVSLGHY